MQALSAASLTLSYTDSVGSMVALGEIQGLKDTMQMTDPHFQ